MKAKLIKKPQFGIGVFVVSFLLLVSLVAAVASFLYLNNLAKYDKEYIRLAGDQRILIELMTRNAFLSLNGDFPAYQNLARHYLQFKKNMKQIKEGNPEIGLPPSPDAVSDRILSLDEKWVEAEKSVTIIIDSEAIIRNYANFARNFQAVLNDVQQGSQQLTIQLVSSSAPAVQVHLASQIELLLTRLSFNTNRFLLDARTTQDVAKQMSSDFQQFNKILNAMLEGDTDMNIPRVNQGSTRTKLTEIRDNAEPLKDMLKSAIDGINFLTQAQGALGKLIDQTDLMLDSATSLRTAYTQLAETRLIRDYTGLVLGAVALLCIIWLAYRVQQETKARLQQTAAQNQRNQNAIMRLLDEICDLANGDLTTQATVTEDITGAIADAINYTVEQLRTLVSSINEITVQVSSAAKTTQATALHLAEASDQQAKQISAASDAINQMATSIDNVSGNANESSDVANQSMTIAKKGASAVQNTIRGMDTIREQIQETSKRIKRLGESSQEIGDMVELINDIADQTNILALNAAIQAAMAGKSGRGFAVVADEVQRLAEKSTDATLQIENLVRTIQSDTNEAVASMEQSISQVVSGAKLALNAGDALSEIENVSTHLAELTQAISKAAQQQAKVSASISESMNVIQNVTVQTAAGTSNTSNSIGALADLSNTLRKSVSGFKLPAN